MKVRTGKWWLLAAAVSVFGLTACDDGADKVECDVATYQATCVDGKIRNVCIDGVVEKQECADSCSAGICFEANAEDCTVTTCVDGKEVLCVNGKTAQAQSCSTGYECVAGVGCQKVAMACIAADYPKCDGNSALLCPAGKVVTEDCLEGQICVDKKGCEVDPDNKCTEAATGCQGGKLMTCTDGAWIASDCAADEVCEVNACVKVVPACDPTDYPKCDGNNALNCIGGKVSSAECLASQICVEKVGCQENPDPCVEADTTCQGGKLMTCTAGEWIASDCEADEVCEGKACVKVVEDCVAADYPQCDGNNALLCTAGKVSSEACLLGQICVDKKGCENDPDNSCTDADTACQAGKLMTCTAGEWVASDCAADEVCRGKACVKKDAPADTAVVVVCGTLSITGSETCAKTGSGAKTVLRGDILTRGTTYEGGSVVVENGKITYVGCDPNMAGATVITCPDAVVSAGLINAHEHITYSNGKPGKWGEERFDHRHDWRTETPGHTKVPGPSTSTNEVPELRNLMSGATSIFGSGAVKGLVRNLDKENTGGVKAPIYQTFPLGDQSGTMADSGCSKYKYKTYAEIGKDECAYGPHIAEGINMAAYNELVCLSTSNGGGYNIFNNRLAIIHGIAATPAMIADMAVKGIKLIWSPRTNISLYGDTAQAPLFDRLGVTVGLGTDWIYSGSANMLRELACVDHLNSHHYNSYFNDYQIWLMATYNNALALGVESVLGDLKVGLIADIAIFKATETKKHHRAVIEAENKDVTLVLLNGNLVFGDANLVTGCETANVCGSQKGLCLSLTGTSMTYASINAAKGYDIFFCNTPNDEPTCVPKRTRPSDTTSQNTTLYSGDYTAANDRDGDGILDAVDNCPDHFNPIRPQDLDRKQKDFDNDGFGDICDTHPLCAANDETCPVFDPNDSDGDGIPNDEDNCPTIANPDQKDTDKDGKGDVCDPCPTVPNPGDLRCPVTEITSIKNFITLVGAECKTSPCKGATEVRIAGRVTAITKDGFFVQDPVAEDAKNSATYVISGSTVAINDDVQIQGFPGLNYDQVQLQDGQAEIISSGNAAVVATPVTVAQVTTGGADAKAYENVLVSVSNLTVQTLDANAAYNMYPVKDASNASIYLDDFVWIIAPAFVAGDSIKKATGVLVFDFANFKIAPRSIDDIVTNTVVKSIAADKTHAEFGSKVNVELTLSDTADVATTVALECENVVACPASVLVAAGSATTTFEITMAAAGDAKVTATLEGRSESVTVIGFDATAPLSIVTLNPLTAEVMIGKTLVVTAELSRPATEVGVMLLNSRSPLAATVPASQAIAIGDTSVDFVVTVIATTAGVEATIEAKIGSTEHKTMVVTSKVGEVWVHTEGFETSTGSDYKSVTSVSIEDGSTLTAIGIVNEAKSGDNQLFISAPYSLVVNAINEGAGVTVTDIPNGVGKVKFLWRSWGGSDDVGTINITVGSKTDSFEYKASDTSKEGVLYEGEFYQSDATTITVTPTVTAKRSRIIIDDFSWSTGK